MVEIFILSLIQGITEFIPVSSSSHLILVSDYLNFEEQSLTIDVSLHIGSFLAVICYFHKEITNFLRNKDLFIKIFISSIPVMFIGYILVETNFIENLRNPQIIAWTTLVFGILLYISDRYNLIKNIEKDFSLKSAIIIGFFQVLSLIPGVSRSGITITAARLLNFKRYDSAKISFLLSIPTLAAVSVYGLKDIILSDDLSFTKFNITAISLSFFFSIITIKIFLKYIQTSSLKIFVIYRILLGALLLVISYL